MHQLISSFINGMYRARNRKRLSCSVGRESDVRLHRVQVRGENRLTIGEQTKCHARILFDRKLAEVAIGDRCFIGASMLVAAQRIEVGDDVMISWGVTIVDHNSHSLAWHERRDDVLNWFAGRKDWSHVKCAPVRICNKAWIGFGAIVLKGVTIGEGAVVGAGAVVGRDVPAYTVVAGNPAEVIRSLNPGAEGN